jgi:hypothetical protein
VQGSTALAYFIICIGHTGYKYIYLDWKQYIYIKMQLNTHIYIFVYVRMHFVYGCTVPQY